jgi:hypothetical protein
MFDPGRFEPLDALVLILTLAILMAVAGAVYKTFCP